MRIYVKGQSTSAAALRGLLAKAGFPLVPEPPSTGFTIQVDEAADAACPIFDSVDCELERQIVSCVTELVAGDVTIRRKGGNVASDREIAIIVPADAAIQEGVEIGVLRGLLKMFPRPAYESEPVNIVPPAPPPPSAPPPPNRRQRVARWILGGPLI